MQRATIECPDELRLALNGSHGQFVDETRRAAVKLFELECYRPDELLHDIAHDRPL
jgi:hypothetical protein